jgi:hypothetical protein
MTGSPLDLVGLVSAAASAVGSASRSAHARPAGTPFADLLDQARQGALSSGLPVTLAEGAGIELSRDQLDRLAAAADRAEGQGAQVAVVMIDGRAIELDVTLRTVLGEVNAQRGIRGDIDTFLFAPPAHAGGVPVPSRAPSNTDLLRLLAEQGTLPTE